MPQIGERQDASDADNGDNGRSEPEPQLKAPTGTETVLVVEDEPSVRSIACRVLRRQGYNVLVASHGADALHVAHEYEGPIDLVITDVVMPELSGAKLVQRLLSERPGIRVLYMSGYPEETVMRHGVAGMDTGFMEKPFSPYDLARRVRQALDMPEAAEQSDHAPGDVGAAHPWHEGR
ncbi:MAG: response regulator [Longimicrobiales bacterium]